MIWKLRNKLLKFLYTIFSFLWTVLSASLHSLIFWMKSYKTPPVSVSHPKIKGIYYLFNLSELTQCYKRKRISSCMFYTCSFARFLQMFSEFATNTNPSVFLQIKWWKFNRCGLFSAIFENVLYLCGCEGLGGYNIVLLAAQKQPSKLCIRVNL